MDWAPQATACAHSVSHSSAVQTQDHRFTHQTVACLHRSSLETSQDDSLCGLQTSLHLHPASACIHAVPGADASTAVSSAGASHVCASLPAYKCGREKGVLPAHGCGWWRSCIGCTRDTSTKELSPASVLLGIALDPLTSSSLRWQGLSSGHVCMQVWTPHQYKTVQSIAILPAGVHGGTGTRQQNCTVAPLVPAPLHAGTAALAASGRACTGVRLHALGPPTGKASLTWKTHN